MSECSKGKGKARTGDSAQDLHQQALQRIQRRAAEYARAEAEGRFIPYDQTPSSSSSLSPPPEDERYDPVAEQRQNDSYDRHKTEHVREGKHKRVFPAAGSSPQERRELYRWRAGAVSDGRMAEHVRDRIKSSEENQHAMNSSAGHGIQVRDFARGPDDHRRHYYPYYRRDYSPAESEDHDHGHDTSRGKGKGKARDVGTEMPGVTSKGKGKGKGKGRRK